MDVLSPATVRDLAQPQDGICCSIYLPTHHKGREIWQDRIRLKNLLKRAEEQLATTALSSSEVGDLLQPARDLTEDSEFWRFQTDGLALFMSSNGMRTFRVPIQLPELTVISQSDHARFHLKPLFPMLTGDGVFYALAVSQDEIRLLRCTRHSFEEARSEVIPQGEDVILRYIEEHKALQWHTQTGYSAQGTRAAVFHGQGAPAAHHKDRIFEYFRLVIQALHRLIGTPARTAEEGFLGAQPPVVFVGVDYLFPIFKEANNGEIHVLDEFVAGNPDEHRVNPRDLHEAAWGVAQPYFDQARQKASEMYKQATGVVPHRVTRDLADAVRAAHDGRMAMVFTPNDINRWGRYDPATGEIEVHQEQDVGDEDLLDVITVHTFIHGGASYVVPRDEMPERGDVAGVTRY